MAFCLHLPEGARLLDVFHVGLPKRYHGTPPAMTPALSPMDDGRVVPVPAQVLRPSLRRSVWHVLVRWEGMDVMEATWEPVEDFKKAYLAF